MGYCMRKAACIDCEYRRSTGSPCTFIGLSRVYDYLEESTVKKNYPFQKHIGVAVARCVYTEDLRFIYCSSDAAR